MISLTFFYQVKILNIFLKNNFIFNSRNKGVTFKVLTWGIDSVINLLRLFLRVKCLTINLLLCLQ